MRNTIRLATAYLTLLIIALYIITGYGITESRIVGQLTFGLLGKALAYQIHSYLIIPFILLLATHLLLSCSLFQKNKKLQKP